MDGIDIGADAVCEACSKDARDIAPAQPSNFHVEYVAQVPGRKSFRVTRKGNVPWLSDNELIKLCDGPPNPGRFGGDVRVYADNVNVAYVDVFTD